MLGTARLVDFNRGHQSAAQPQLPVRHEGQRWRRSGKRPEGSTARTRPATLARRAAAPYLGNMLRLRGALVGIGLAMALFLPGTAEAKNCGNAAAYLRDVRTSRVGCVEAKALARAVWRADGCVPADGGGSTARCVLKRYTCTTRRG